jgi:hypothetical protein
MPAPPIGGAGSAAGNGAVNSTMQDALGAGGQMAGAAGGPGGAPGAGAEQVQQGLMALMERIRSVDSDVQALAADMPELAPQVEQIRNIFKQMVVSAAQAAPTATASGSAVPA